MNIEFLCCPICYEQYNQAEHLPRIIRQCGHTICSTCLNMILTNRYQARCPLDYKDFSFFDARLEAFPVNFTLSQLCDIKYKRAVCGSHDEDLCFVCLTDGIKICEECVGDTKHKGHEIKSIKTIIKETNSKRREIKLILDKLDMSHADLEKMLREQKDVILTTIRTEFDEMRNILAQKEQEMIFEVHSTFDTENKKITNLTGNNSFLRTTLNRKVQGLDDFLKQQDFINYEVFLEQIQKIISEYNSKILSDTIVEEASRIKGELEEKCQDIIKYIADQSTMLSDSEFSFESHYAANLSQIFSDVTILDNLPRESLFISRFALTYSDMNLKISNTSPEMKENAIDVTKLDQVKSVNLDLRKNILDEKDLVALSYIWKKIREPPTLELEFAPGSINNKVIPILLQGPRTSSEITISLKGYNMTEQSCVAPFIGKLLARMTNLRAITLELDNAKLSRQDIETIFQAGRISRPGIENLSLSFNKTHLRDADVRNIFTQLPSLKSIILNLCGTSITNQTVETFSKQTLESAKSLEKLVFWTDQPQVTDLGFQNMFLSLENLKMLCLGLMSTTISDKTVEFISQALARSCDTLEDFRLITNSTQVTDQAICKIFKCMPNMKFFGMDLSGTSITDKTLKTFAQDTLQSMSLLEDLTVILNRTKITDMGLEELFRGLPYLKTFQAGFISTKVTNKAVEVLMEEKLPLLLSLNELQMDLSNTFVSGPLQTQIQDLSRSLNGRQIL